MTFSEYQQGLWTPPPAPPRRSHAKVWISFVVLIAVIAGSFAIVSNRQYLVDQWTVWTFEASPEITAYATRSTMTDHGEFLFLASQPEIASAESFNSVCKNHEEGSGVLGCYASGDKRITLFDVTDERLDGIEEVVAAHEMLHAAWDRMSEGERTRIGVLLETEAAVLSSDSEFAARMEYYARTEPGERLNELHSIIGTEVGELAPELEDYYSQYFSQRSALVALHTTSNAVFVNLEKASAALVAEIDALRAEIEADYAAYNAGYDTLNADIAAFNLRADNPDSFDSQEEFDSQRNALISRQQSLDRDFASIQSREVSYNSKVEQLSAFNAQAAALNTAINVVPRTAE